MTIQKSLYLAALAAAVLVPAAREADAGLRQHEYVNVNTTGRSANGALASAYSSSDTVQYIGCNAYAFAGGSEYTVCVAVNSSGVSASCVTSDAKLVALARGIDAESRLYFAWNTSGQCTNINVSHHSIWNPKP